MRDLACKMCSAVFPNLRSLKGHKRDHVPAGNLVGPYLCHMCLHEAVNKTSLLRHIANHKGCNPYECKVCSRSFTTKSNCERHLRNAHHLAKRVEITSSTIYLNPIKDSGVGESTRDENRDDNNHKCDNINSDLNKENGGSSNSELGACCVPKATSNISTFNEFQGCMKTEAISQENHLQLQHPFVENNCGNNSLPKEPILVPFSAVKSTRSKRFRTERPFSCEYCSTKFTLHPNKERHIRQQHPQFWKRKRYPESISVEEPKKMSALNGNSPSTQLVSTVQNNTVNNVNGNTSSCTMKTGNAGEEILQELALTLPYKDLKGTTSNFEEPMSLQNYKEPQIGMECNTIAVNMYLAVSKLHEYYKKSILEALLTQSRNQVQPIEEINSATKEQEQPVKTSETNFLPSSKVPTPSTMAFDNSEVENNVILSGSDKAMYIPESFSFRCHVCDTVFLQRIDCLMHIIKCHPEEYIKIKKKCSIEINESFHNVDLSTSKIEFSGRIGGRKVICVFCIRHFWSSEDLRRHVRTHSGEQPFSCAKCGKKFTLKHSLVRHVKQHCKYNVVAPSMPHQSQKDLAKALPPAKLSNVQEHAEEHGGELWLLSKLLEVSNETCSKLLSCPAAEAANILGIDNF